jgi:hypothetical protein
MQKTEIKVGEEYALRETQKADDPFQHVKILQHVRGKKWRAEWIDPNPGLVDYVESQQLIVRWKGRQAFLRDEDQARRLQEDNKRQGYKEDSPLANVLYEVFEATGEKGLTFYKGVLSGPPDALERVRERSHFDRTKSSLYTYSDRYGTVHIPYVEALELAKAFCKVEPSAVLVKIESSEREWSQEAAHPGKEYMGDLLNEYRASWAIIRQWAGYDVAIAQREAQIKRLERLVWDAIYALQKAGVDAEAHRLRRAIQPD